MLEHWNTHFAQSSWGPPDRRRRRGVTEGVWRRSLPRHISYTCFKNVVVTVPAFQPGGDLGDSRWKPAQTHFQAISGLESWNTHRHSECARLFQCAELSSAVVNMHSSVLDMVNRHAVPVRIDCVATYLLSQCTLGRGQHARWHTC